ncbi:MAG: glycosyltransferase family 4 protein, partial [Chloroflexaceae bacterium]|nr:glycosyltransferase family 4 protein [Chloroflexaceae bacterium]
VLATSWDYARASRLRHLLRACPARLDELPNGVDTERCRPGLESISLRTRYRLPPDARVVLFVGALDQAHYFKGIPVLIEALRLLADTRTRLLIVGDGNLRPLYEQHTWAAGVAGQVHFCGRVSSAELPLHYALADVLVLPSVTMGEAFGMVLLEALACGTPVIASNLPGVRSVVNDGCDGVLVPPGDAAALAAALRRFPGDAVARGTAGAHGRAKVVERYSWPVLIPRLEAIYDKVLLTDAGHG